MVAAVDLGSIVLGRKSSNLFFSTKNAQKALLAKHWFCTPAISSSILDLCSIVL